MQIKSADMLKFIELMKNKPAETQLRMMWLLITALIASFEQLQAYRDADFKALHQYAKAYEEIESKFYVDHAMCDVQLTAMFEKLAKELKP